jgi:pilus assembly protein CpaE
VIKLVSSDPRLAQAFRETGLAYINVPHDAVSALAQPAAPQPRILAVDLREDQHFPAELSVLKKNHPATAVVLVVARLDPALMLEAMRAGVSEIVPEPISVTELQAALKRLGSSAAGPSRGEMFAFIGAKGGVGATTIAVNVATALAKSSSESTLLVDLNAMCGDAAVFLGEEPRFSVLDALENVQRLDASYFRGLVVKTGTGLDLLGAAGRPGVNAFDPARVRELLEFVSQSRRYTVLDVPRSDSAALDSLELATKIVLVANQELATVRNASRMASTLRQRYGRDRLVLVLTRTDRRAEIGHEDVEKTVGLDVRHTFPSDYRVAVQAMNKGRPIVLDNHNDLAGAFTSFARDLAGLSEPDRGPKAQRGSVFGRLWPRRA